MNIKHEKTVIRYDNCLLNVVSSPAQFHETYSSLCGVLRYLMQHSSTERSTKQTENLIIADMNDLE